MEASITDLATNLGGPGSNGLVPLMDAPFICPGCKIHQGYLKATMALFDKDPTFRNALLKGNGKPTISVSGYSQGAGLAIVFGALLQSRGYTVAKVIAFSGAKIGNLAFRAWTKTSGLYDKIWRPVYQRDIIPKLPPSWMGYYNTGWEIHYTCPSNSNFLNF